MIPSWTDSDAGAEKAGKYAAALRFRSQAVDTDEGASVFVWTPVEGTSTSCMSHTRGLDGTQCPVCQPPQVHRAVLLVCVGAPGGHDLSNTGLIDYAAELAADLPKGWRVLCAQRFGEPSIEQVLRDVEAEGVEELVVIPMYPQFSEATNGAILKEFYRLLILSGRHISVATRAAWYDDGGYINAQARLIAEYVHSQGLSAQDTHLLFAAHAIQVAGVRRGDPYTHQVNHTLQLVVERLGWPGERVSVGYQSGPGSGEWHGPSVDARLVELASAGAAKVLICPLTPTRDCAEVADEAAARHRDWIEANGGSLHTCPSLSDYEPFVAVVRNLVLRGTRPIALGRAAAARSLLFLSDSEPIQEEPKPLVMIGASVAGRLRSSTGPELRHSDPRAFARIRRSRKELRVFLDRIREQADVDEAFVWSTCQRVEFYGWLADPDRVADGECLVAHIRQQLYGVEPEGLQVNVLFGSDAWHHLMRTAVGLNSALPGDSDVVDQLQTSCRIGERAGTARRHAVRLVNDAVGLVEAVRTETTWGGFSPGYCSAALLHLDTQTKVNLDECRHVVIGGSATSRSVLATLSQQFKVPERQMTLVYRDHHGQMKLLRAALGHGTRLRVHSYSEQPVVRAVADADFVYFGIDHTQPAISAAELDGLRDYVKRPLTIVDFNPSGSMSETETPPEGVTLWSAEKLDMAVAEYAEVLCNQENFARAVNEAEDWIAERVPVLAGVQPELPCGRDDHEARPACGTCWVGFHATRKLAESRVRQRAHSV